MSDIQTQNKCYPFLSDIMKADDLPDFLSFIKGGISSNYDFCAKIPQIGNYLCGNKLRMILIFLFHSACLLGISQTQINKYLSIKKTEKGQVFVSDTGIQSQEYTYIHQKSNGFFEGIIVTPVPDSVRIAREQIRHKRCGFDYENSHRTDLYIFDIMTELKIIDSYHFNNTSNEWIELPDYEENYGFATLKGKAAMISKKGEILTDFKYNNYFFLDNSYFDRGKLISVKLDKITGKELFATADTIMKYWNNQNYILKDKRNNFLFTFKSRKYKVAEIFSKLDYLPIDSEIFTFNCNQTDCFRTIDGKKVKTKNKTFVPCTNFYKGYCIAYEIIKGETKTNFYGELIQQRDIKHLVLINENFDVIKSLDHINLIDGGFNKYGLLKVADHVGYYVIDYEGNNVIPPPSYNNRIKEFVDGLYYIYDYSLHPSNESKLQTNIYNQKGEKLFDNETIKSVTNFNESTNFNYISSYKTILMKLDKNNNIIKKYF